MFYLIIIGLEGALFQLLDYETDAKLKSDIRDILSHVLQATAISKLEFWLKLSKSVLSASSGFFS